MFRKFIEGLVFGAGFMLSAVVVGLIGSSFVFTSTTSRHSDTSRSPMAMDESLQEEQNRYHELPIEQQIEKSSVIVLARYVPGEDGRMKAVVAEFLKRDPQTVFHYEVGDEYSPSSYYPKAGTRYADGLVIFFIGSPAEMRLSMSYSGERIQGLGDMPVKLLRDKCAAEAVQVH